MGGIALIANQLKVHRLTAVIMGALTLSVVPVVAHSEEFPLYAFGAHKGGNGPAADLISDTAGNLYGTTEFGGQHRKGTVFMLTPGAGSKETWTQTVLYSFGGHGDGVNPIQGLAIDKDGALYGTTTYGGGRDTLNQGVVFKLTPPPTQGGVWTEEIIHRFCSVAGCKDGSLPNAPLTLGPKGVLYGTATAGGDGGGVVFQLSPPRGKNGAWVYSILTRFYDQAWGPWGRLLLKKDGNIIGTTAFSGGFHTGGTLFQLAPLGDGQYQFNLLHDFSLEHHDGTSPVGLTADKAGVLYGVTEFGGRDNCGSAFSFDPAAAEYRQLYSFCPNGDGTGGRTVAAGVTVKNGPDGRATALYGTARGSDVGFGTVFKLTPGKGSDPWVETVLYTFCPSRSDCRDGDLPASALLPLSGGLYGITAKGGRQDAGVFYRVEE